MPLLSCKNVSLAYDGATVATDITFDVNEGDYLCILGRNGSGKSTLIKALAGLIKPADGQILYGDKLTAKQVGYLPQATVIQRNFPASVREVVLSGTRSLFYSKKDKQKADEVLQMLGLTDIQKHACSELSGGQLQRVLLARALCASTKLLLLDEPTAGLDKLVTEELYGIVNKLNREQGITVIIISHDIDTSLTDSTHILHMDHRVLFYGTSDEYINSGKAKRFWGVGE